MFPSNLQLLLLIFLSHGFTKHLTIGQSDDRSRNVTEVNYDERDDATLVRADVPALSNEFFPWLNKSEEEESIMVREISFPVDVYRELFVNETQRAINQVRSRNGRTLPLTGWPTVRYVIQIDNNEPLKQIAREAIEEWSVNTCIKFKDTVDTYMDNFVFIRDNQPVCHFGFSWRTSSVTFIDIGEEKCKTEIMRTGSVPAEANNIIYQGPLRRSQTRLSHRDKLSINKQYNCLETWKKYYNCQEETDPCLNEGYTGPNCTCVCRPGTDGNYCQHVSKPDYYGHLLPSCSRDINETTTIQSPGYPQDIPYDSWCVFKIFAPENHTIKVRFTDFHLAKSGNDCIESFLEIREESFDILGKVFCGEEIYPEQEFTSVSNEMAIYLDVMNNNSRGFAAEILFLKSASATLNIASSYIYVSLIFTLLWSRASALIAGVNSKVFFLV